MEEVVGLMAAAKTSTVASGSFHPGWVDVMLLAIIGFLVGFALGPYFPWRLI